MRAHCPPPLTASERTDTTGLQPLACATCRSPIPAPLQLHGPTSGSDSSMTTGTRSWRSDHSPRSRPDASLAPLPSALTVSAAARTTSARAPASLAGSASTATTTTASVNRPRRRARTRSGRSAVAPTLTAAGAVPTARRASTATSTTRSAFLVPRRPRRRTARRAHPRSRRARHPHRPRRRALRPPAARHRAPLHRKKQSLPQRPALTMLVRAPRSLTSSVARPDRSPQMDNVAVRTGEAPSAVRLATRASTPTPITRSASPLRATTRARTASTDSAVARTGLAPPAARRSALASTKTIVSRPGLYSATRLIRLRRRLQPVCTWRHFVRWISKDQDVKLFVSLTDQDEER